MVRRSNVLACILVLAVLSLAYMNLQDLRGRDSTLDEDGPRKSPFRGDRLVVARQQINMAAKDDGNNADATEPLLHRTRPHGPNHVKATAVSGGEAMAATVKVESRIGVLLIACNRVEVKRAIDSLLKYRPVRGFPIVVSQDCGDATTAREGIDPYEDRLIHLQQPDLGPIAALPQDQQRFASYYKISRHYKWALSEMFDVLMFDQIIIVEDDLEIAPDFFTFFEATLPLLTSDPSLYCVSAWNDNGKAQLIDDNHALRRTDFFPGLGWMMSRTLWDELKPKWPASFWDDWLRHPDQRKDRACIHPEISRTYTFGERGASVGQYWNEHLRHIVLNSQYVAFNKMANLTTQLRKETYDNQFLKDVYETASAIDGTDVRGIAPRGDGEPRRLYRVTYTDRASFEGLSRYFELMSDLRSGIPRGAYKGVVEFKHKGHRIFLAPPLNWGGYSTLAD